MVGLVLALAGGMATGVDSTLLLRGYPVYFASHGMVFFLAAWLSVYASPNCGVSRVRWESCLRFGGLDMTSQTDHTVYSKDQEMLGRREL